MKNIYILLTKSNTVLAKSIRKITKTEFSHSSIAFDSKLDLMYSFARRNPKNPFVGRLVRENTNKGLLKVNEETGCLVYVKSVTDSEYEIILDFIDCILTSEKEWKFNIIGLIGCGLNIPLMRKRKRCCSQFVSQSLSNVHDIHMNRHVMTMQPNDFRVTKGLKLIYCGMIKDIPPEFTEYNSIQINDDTLIEKESPCD